LLSPSQGLISLSLEEEESSLEGEGGEERSLSTKPLGFKVMVLLVGQFKAMFPFPKNFKHFMELDL